MIRSFRDKETEKIWTASYRAPPEGARRTAEPAPAQPVDPP